MEKFEKFSGIAAPMPLVNIDTDMIIPKQFLKTIKRSGLGVNAFAEMRYKSDGSEVEDFVLNKQAYRDSSILVAGDNFGCGSSREHAPWALSDFGIKVVVSTSFADIFFNNCFKNGILPIQLSEKLIKEISESALKGNELQVSLSDQIINCENKEFSFKIDKSNKNFLMEGLDDIGLTLQDTKLIDTYEKDADKNLPWYNL